jgi:gas vesicle protein
MTDNSATGTIEQSMPRHGFMLGLVTGGIIGAVLALAFAPRAGVQLRRSVAGAAKTLGTTASKRYQDASVRVGDAVGHLSSKAQAVRNDAADAVASGAHDVARFATSLKS